MAKIGFGVLRKRNFGRKSWFPLLFTFVVDMAQYLQVNCLSLVELNPNWLLLMLLLLILLLLLLLLLLLWGLTLNNGQSQVRNR